MALNSVGRPDQALAVLKRAQTRHTGDTDILLALATIHRDLGNTETALRYARHLAALVPGDPGIRQLVESLAAEARGGASTGD